MLRIKLPSVCLREIKTIHYLECQDRWVFLLILIIGAFCLIFAEELSAETRKISGPVNIEADTLNYIKDTDTYHAQ